MRAKHFSDLAAMQKLLATQARAAKEAAEAEALAAEHRRREQALEVVAQAVAAAAVVETAAAAEVIRTRRPLAQTRARAEPQPTILYYMYIHHEDH